MAATGWTWAEVGRLTLSRYKALAEQWRRHPPCHLLLAAWLGVEEAGKPAKQDFESFFKDLTGNLPPV